MTIRCAIPGDGYQQVLFWINKISRIWGGSQWGWEAAKIRRYCTVCTVQSRALVLCAGQQNHYFSYQEWQLEDASPPGTGFGTCDCRHLSIYGCIIDFRHSKTGVSWCEPNIQFCLDAILSRKGLSTAEDFKVWRLMILPSWLPCCSWSGLWNTHTKQCLWHPRGAGPQVWSILRFGVPDPSVGLCRGTVI